MRKGLRADWDRGTLPVALEGKYRVTMLGWLSWALHGNIKVISGLLGCSRWRGHYWGLFVFYPKAGERCLVLDYWRCQPWYLPWKYIEDEVRWTPNGVLLGKFCLRWFSVVIQVGWFTMKRIREE